MSDHVVNRTDPDACLVGNAKGTARMGYKAHYVVDGGKARVILTALVTKADVKDSQPMLDLLWHTIFRWKLRPHHATGDSVYGTRPPYLVSVVQTHRLDGAQRGRGWLSRPCRCTWLMANRPPASRDAPTADRDPRAQFAA